MSLWNKLSGGMIKAKDGWMVDSESDACLLCRSVFSLTTRRHHCRVCYRLVCGSCSNHNVEIDDDGCHHRVCDDCFTKLGSGGLVGQDSSFGENRATYFRVRCFSKYFAITSSVYHAGHHIICSYLDARHTSNSGKDLTWIILRGLH